MKNKTLITVVLLMLTTQTTADTTADEIALLKQQLKVLSDKIDQLELKSKQKEQQVVEKPIETPKKEATASRFSFSGDFRDRFEYIDQRGNKTRTRNRIRFRIGSKIQVTDDASIGFRLASGQDEPFSTNQTLGDGFSTKDIRLDLAYFNWKLNDETTLIGGKMQNPLYRSARTPVLWDNDLNPEGFSLIYDKGDLRATLIGFSVDERRAEDDILLFGGQVTKSFKVSNTSKLIAGLGYYDYQNLQGSEPLFRGRAYGNTLDINGNIAYDFNIAEAMLEFNTDLADRPFSLFANYFQNTQVDDQNSAYSLGFNYGRIKDKGSWDFGYAFLKVETNSVYGLLNDSDVAAGNTDSRGHLIRTGYALDKNKLLNLIYIDSEQNQSTDQPTQYDRLQMDFTLRFK
ncbi:MAG: putative porin [Proteobacteria bacterium]|nr:putative porin [Pseudomonadota bacterium]